MKRILTVALVVVACLALVALTGCSGGGATQTPSTSGTSTSGSNSSGGASAGGAVSIANFAFSPASVTVKVGQTVTWTNNDSVAHTVTSDDGSFDSGQLSPGATFKHTFDKAGQYSYHCSVHPDMTGSVTVQ